MGLCEKQKIIFCKLLLSNKKDFLFFVEIEWFTVQKSLNFGFVFEVKKDNS